MGFWGTGGQGHSFQGNKGQILRGTGEQRQYWGTGNIENKFSIFGDQGSKPINFRGAREQVPPWEGLHNGFAFQNSLTNVHGINCIH